MVFKVKVPILGGLLLGHLLLHLQLGVLGFATLPLLLLPLLLRRDGNLELRVHRLHFGEIRVHKVAEQDLAVEWTARVG